MRVHRPKLAPPIAFLHKARVSTSAAGNPRIVVLDGHTLNPGDLSWRELEALGETSIYDRTPGELVVERAREADLVLTNKTVVTREHIAALKPLRYVGVLATGFNVVDVEAD